MTDEEKLQKYLPLIRNTAGWTAEDLGQKIGVTKQTISNIETLKTKMSKTQYLAIQMVISQKIATTKNDTTLANIMKMVFENEEEQTIDYSKVEKAITTVQTTTAESVGSTIAGAALGAGGVAGAMAMLGLDPVGAVSAAILGATISPWLTKALTDDNDNKDKLKSK